ncbi:hypothetical protein CCH79_00003875 [Gambusia affinis]|uniref:Uncharacterized protein n=1 Tax=Gambusia affinis TaxID=33528 RepID=A0A315VCB4_GAMAF|nr:hypothetical protein CCH79_00003875 [Gambusia affinis]
MDFFKAEEPTPNSGINAFSHSCTPNGELDLITEIINGCDEQQNGSLSAPLPLPPPPDRYWRTMEDEDVLNRDGFALLQNLQPTSKPVLVPRGTADPLFRFSWQIFSSDVVVASLEEHRAERERSSRRERERVIRKCLIGLEMTGQSESFLPSSHSSTHSKHKRTAFMSMSSIPLVSHGVRLSVAFVCRREGDKPRGPDHRDGLDLRGLSNRCLPTAASWLRPPISTPCLSRGS